MKKFMAIFLGSEEAMQRWNALDEKTKNERNKAGMESWGRWVQEHKKAIVEVGAPLGKTKLVNAEGVAATKNAMTAFTVVQAESHDAAAKLFIDHPHFKLFPGESVEVMECLPIPGM